MAASSSETISRTVSLSSRSAKSVKYARYKMQISPFFHIVPGAYSRLDHRLEGKPFRGGLRLGISSSGEK